jgi:hypothetical protein
LDTNEPSVTTDNAGAFSNLRLTSGNLISIGGLDAATNITLDKFWLTSHSGDNLNLIISPVTSIATLLLPQNKDAAYVKSMLGIDSSIDIYTQDPLVQLDQAIYKNLYIVGNKTGVFSLSLQNFFNAHGGASDSTSEYFKIMAETLQSSYDQNQSAQIIDDPSVFGNVIDQVVSSKSLSVSSQTLDDFKALMESLYYIDYKNNNSIDLGLQNFMLQTLQDDVKLVAQNNLGSSTLNSYKNTLVEYIANDQNLTTADIDIPITANNDSVQLIEDVNAQVIEVFSNDKFKRSQSISLDFTGVTSAGATFQANNTNADPGNIKHTSSPAGNSINTNPYINGISYSPQLNFCGQDSFEYTLIQGSQKSTAEVSVEVACTNDNPTVISRNFSNTGGGTAVFDNVGANDIDGDALSYSIGGTDAQYISVAGNGDLSFTNAVSYASPSDSNGDNIYDFTVTVNDGSTSVTQNFQVEVKPGGSAPIFSGTTSNPSFYSDSSITIQINASDPDGDAISLSISNPSGFSIASNANGFEITNSSGLAAGSYTVQGVITDNNFNTSFSFEINVFNSPSEPPRLSLNGSDVSVSSVRRRVFLYEGNRAISWGWDTANDRPVANWPTDKPYFKFDNVNLSSLIIDPQSFSLEVSYIQARNKDGNVSDYNSDETDKLIQIENFSTGDCSNLGSNGGNGDREFIEFNAGATSCTIAFNLRYNRRASFKRITDSSEFTTQGTGTFHNRMALIEPDHNLDFDLKLTNADKSEVYSFTAEVAALNEHPFLSPLNGDNLVDEYIYTDCSANPYSSCIEYAPTLRVNTAAGERTFEFYVKDDARGTTQIAVDFVTFSNNHAEASRLSCVAVASNDANHSKCTGTIQQSVYESSSIGDTLKTVLRLTDTYPGDDTLTSYFPVYVTLR